MRIGLGIKAGYKSKGILSILDPLSILGFAWISQ
jgi:hypothetical protein